MAIASFSLLVNSLGTPLLALAQTATESPSPTPTDLSSPTPTPTDTATPTIEPSASPTATPDLTPTPDISPTPTVDVTPTPTDLVSPTPTATDAAIVSPAPETTPTTPGPPPSSEVAGESTSASNTPAPSPSATPEVPQEHGNVSATLLHQTNAASVTEDSLGLAQTSSSATLTTNKPDYAPTDAVIITGTGFIANKTYTIEITSQDAPAVDFKDQVKANDKGDLFYTYQLDGNYRPNYKVEVFSGNTVVAGVTFTDGNEAANLDQCRNGSAGSPSNCIDTGGGSLGWVNGNAGSSDSHYVEGYSIPYRVVMTHIPTSTSITITFGYDITHSSKHAIDYLTHYNRLQPHSIFGHPAESINPLFGVAGVSGTITTFAIPAPSSSGSPVSGQPTTSFNALPAGERLMTLFGGTITAISYVSQGNLTNAQSETRIAITFRADSSTAVMAWGGHIATGTDWGIGNSAGGISGSPYHMRLEDWTLDNLGNQDRSLSADAVIIPGTVTVNKVLEPGNDVGKFNLQIDGSTAGTGANVGNGGTTGAISVTTTGTHTVGETAGTSTNLSNYTTTYSCVDGQTSVASGSGSTSSAFTVASGHNIVCTFTNILKQGNIKIVKNTTGGNGTFGFTIAGPSPSTPSIVTSGGTGNTGLIPVNSGSYSVSETVPSGWSLTSSSCDSGTPGQFRVDPGGTVTCTFNDTKHGHFIVNKVTDPASDTTTEFSVTATGSGTIISNATQIVTGGSFIDFEVTPGIYSANETNLPIGWQQYTNSCSGIVVNAGEPYNCYITNTKLGSISGSKLDASSGFGLSGWSISLYNTASKATSTTTTANDGSYSFTDLWPSVYTLSELLQSGWTQIVAPTNPINLTAGQNLTGQNFSNFQKITISGQKFNDLNGNGTKDQGEPGLIGWQINLGGSATASTTTDGSGNYSFTDLGQGTYTLTETPQGGWTQTTTNPAPIVAVSGQNVTGVDFGNRGNLTITACKFEDSNGPTQGGIFSPVLGWNMTLNDRTTQQTGDNGCTTFEHLTPGDYSVTEGSREGWFSADGQTTQDITLPNDSSTLNFYNYRKSTITVIKDVVASDGTELTDTSTGFVFGMTGQDSFTLHDEDGGKAFTVNPGTYTVTETPDPNYAFAGCQAVYEGKSVGNSTDFGKIVIVDSNDSVTVTCTNRQKTGTISGLKWNDLNDDGHQLDGDFLEPTIQGWKITLEHRNGEGWDDPISTFTNSDGNYEFSDLNPGEYRVCEVQQPGWEQTYPDGCYTRTIGSKGTSTGNDFGNFSPKKEIKIIKSNDSPNSSAGSTVTYTLTIKNTGNVTLFNVGVTDVLPGGFTYIDGSTTGATFLSFLGSVITWDAGTINIGDSVIITYKASTASDLSAGTYTNFATCKSFTSPLITEDELSIRSDRQEVDCDPTNSNVTLGSGQGYGGTLTPQVLGASTELPATGSDTGILAFTIAAIVGGVAIKIYGRGKKYGKN